MFSQNKNPTFWVPLFRFIVCLPTELEEINASLPPNSAVPTILLHCSHTFSFSKQYKTRKYMIRINQRSDSFANHQDNQTTKVTSNPINIKQARHPKPSIQSCHQQEKETMHSCLGAEPQMESKDPTIKCTSP